MFLAIVLSALVFPTGLCQPPPVIDPGKLTPSKSLGDCQVCKIYVQSFKNGLDRTARGKYEGGDAAWEEEKLKVSYKRSEMRLVDIQEGICREISKYEVQCHSMAEKAEEFIEEWWAQDPEQSEDLFAYICIDRLKMCCPEHHFGKDCAPCLGDHSNLCSGNGKCRGDGTRKGNGTCLCNPGYTGDNCDKCSLGYYSTNEDDKTVCLLCHKSCMGGCREATPKDCVACKPGYKFDSEKGCIDVNECDNLNTCKTNEFCLNSIGSFTCMKCDKSCQSCHGDGPDMCRKCANGYSKQGELCIADNPMPDYTENLTTTREDL